MFFCYQDDIGEVTTIRVNESTRILEQGAQSQ